MKLRHARLLLFALNLVAALLPGRALAQKSEPQIVTRSLNVREAYACSLNVWNRQTLDGEHERKLSELSIILRAQYLGSSLREREAPSGEPRGSFRLQRLELKYFRNWPGGENETGVQEISENVDWDKLKIRVDTPKEETVALLRLPPEKELPQVTLHSTLAMARNDLMRIGAFAFVPEQAGVYELRYQVLHKRRVTFEKSELLEARCPEIRPRLVVLNAGVLHQVRVPKIQMPLVASTFFEPGSEQWNQNASDRVFRSVFWGLTAKRLACRPLTAKLLLLEDPTSSLGSPAQFELANRRALTLMRLFEEKAPLFRSGAPCANLLSGRNGHAPRDTCVNRLVIDTPWPGQSQVFIKAGVSGVSPEWFAQENRVVPLVASLEAQRVIFEPLKLKPLEESDEIELRCENGLPEAVVNCVRRAQLEVANAAGETRLQPVSLESLQAAARGERTLRLDSAEMREFLRQGKFSARLLWQTSAADSLLRGEATAFTIERRNIVRDEVFALSPYDRADLIYALDHERIANLSREILRTVRDSLSAKSSEIFVLITGHSDSLGEHRAKGLGRDYNLGLSFRRAIYLRELLTDSLKAHAAEQGTAVRARRETYYIPSALRESVSRHVNNPVILEILKRPNCAETEPECASANLQSHLDLLIEEKVRHFKAGLAQENLQLADVPSAKTVRAHIAALRALLPVEVVTYEFASAAGPRYLHFISTGFGAAAPFYRRVEVAGELEEVFCRMGFKPEEYPAFFFGKDAHPTGRLMNRRVELNMVW